MDKKIFTVALLGVGSRGGNVYGKQMCARPDKFKVVALCDPNTEKLEYYGTLFGVDAAMRFTNEDDFFASRLADAVVISTFDNYHARECVRAFELGYDVLLEKPVAYTEEDALAVAEAMEKHGRRGLVCHVLRYSPVYLKAAELIDSGSIGRLVYLDACEPVNYWHHSHSFVRGNSSTTKNAAPMIISKCCHDLDLIQFFVKSRCKSVTSVGNLYFFNENNAPKGSSDRCVSCSMAESCPYSAKLLYIDRWKKLGQKECEWPFSMLACAPLTEEKLLAAITEGPYGRCVFRCDNDVCDTQTVNMQFENGVVASFRVTAFTQNESRRYIFHGTYGSVELNNEAVILNVWGKEPVVYPVSDLVDKGESHGGGDVRLIDSFYDTMCGKGEGATTLSTSMEGYFIGIAAEKSRKMGGALVKVHD